jgi:8-amino-7-oxononanoate synthase
MKNIQQQLIDLLESRRKEGLLRQLQVLEGRVDFCSNDYLGLGADPVLAANIARDFEALPLASRKNGSTGSRLISGQSALIEQFENECAAFHGAEACLLFSSGYDANVGLISSLPQEGDVIFCDKLLHASLIDGLRLSKAERRIFKHNNLEDLVHLLDQYPAETRKWIVVESVYSMDGDIAPLNKLVDIKNFYGAELIVDEAHSGGIYGSQGQGLVFELGLNEEIFARVITFGKAWGNAGAVVLGSLALKEYLVNFARSFIYSTAPTPAHVSALVSTLHYVPSQNTARQKLQENIAFFRSNIHSNAWGDSETAIQTFFVTGNEAVRAKAAKASEFAIKPIVSPTVPKGKERIRITLSALQTKDQILALITTLE